MEMTMLLILGGCAGFGIVATSDPEKKLNDAYYLYSRGDRPLPAETLISEAIEIFQKRGDARGLGDAYREYGNLLQSKSLSKWGSRMNFHDKSVTYENRFDKSSEYFRKTLDAYKKVEQSTIEAKQYDELTNLYCVTAWVYNGLHEPKNSCIYFDKSLEAYAENIRLNPSASPFVPQGFTSFPELVVYDRKSIGLDCKAGRFEQLELNGQK